MFEIQKANITMEDLREARRNCNVYDEFVKFSQAMDDTQDWIDNNNWSRAKNMLIIVGNSNTLYRMVENNRKTLRYSALKDFLIREVL